MGEYRLLLKHVDVPNYHEIQVYEQYRGYQALRKALCRWSAKRSSRRSKSRALRGRGGAGFPAWIKWNGIPKDDDKPHYVLCNSDEGEPGTFKDFELMFKTPHQLIEGMIIAGYAVRAKWGYIYIRGEYVECARRVRQAIDQAYAAGYLGKNISRQRFRLRPLHSHGRRLLRVRRGVGDDVEPDGRAWAAAPQVPPRARCPQLRACGTARRSSTTANRSAACPTLSPTAGSGTRNWAPAPKTRAARKSSPCRGM
jgi:hypothetical protein